MSGWKRLLPQLGSATGRGLVVWVLDRLLDAGFRDVELPAQGWRLELTDPDYRTGG